MSGSISQAHSCIYSDMRFMIRPRREMLLCSLCCFNLNVNVFIESARSLFLFLMFRTKMKKTACSVHCHFNSLLCVYEKKDLLSSFFKGNMDVMNCSVMKSRTLSRIQSELLSCLFSCGWDVISYKADLFRCLQPIIGQTERLLWQQFTVLLNSSVQVGRK